ncbi:cellobiose transport system permease protein [Nocardioides aromaticivorans]|uniref:Cellobiose transport system permease protein n=1 Tax=Nocardioides aromaticivorans TaxID=200618 RepID=A0A7Y9ZL52_9ACTN|nr:sugar ABC transporter permease [Nocardioides aromaticivorans]NYI46910.1 cellobiose transport system permease protein [Nocardioides aromaticivorans]QSR26064.1 sugar ABC transporter permease [Nocardioides aromaticivorans]
MTNPTAPAGDVATATSPADRPPEQDSAGEGSPRNRRLVRRQRRSRWDVKLSPYLYVSPFFVLFAIVGLYPLLYTGYLSLFDWNRAYYVRGDFVGLDNYSFVLTDPVFRKSLVNTFSIFLMSSVPQVVLAVAVAALLDTRLRGRTFWRMSVLLPFVVAPTAAVLIFGSLFADRYGMINQLLGEIGLEPIRWHVDRWWSHFAIAGMVNWRWTGYNALIFLAAMQAVPRDLYEAASLDGAGRIRQFFAVTLPMIRPTMIFVIITSTIGGLQIFTEPRLFDDTPNREGGPDHQYMTSTLYIYVKGIEDQFYGRASAAAWILFLIIVGIALLNFGVTRFLTRRSVS